MLRKKDSGEPEHFPKSDLFQFDDEVARIFPNMAQRSIPLYEQMHRLHAYILLKDYVSKDVPTYNVLDIGASRAKFLGVIEAVAEEMDVDISRLRYTATDKSEHMIEEAIRNDGIDVPYEYGDFSADYEQMHGDLLAWPYDHDEFDAVVLHYVMQFIPVAERGVCYNRLRDLLPRNGLLFYGEKETLLPYGSHTPTEALVAEAAADYYIDFRIENGYSRAEIEAKTAALGNSMWPVSYEHDTKRNLRHANFDRFVETARLGLFHSFVAIKGAE